MTRRLQIPTKSFTLRQNTMKLTGYKLTEEAASYTIVVTSRTKCYFCLSRKNRFSKVK